MKDQKKFHEKALRRYDSAYTPQTGIRALIRDAIRFARKNGAQWEGTTVTGWCPKETMADRPLMEINRVANSIERITANGKNSRISVKFRPGDDDASAKLAESLSNLFRADFNGCEGEEASDTAFEDAVAGGFGCIRLTTAPESDDADPDDPKRKRIVFEYVPESYSVVWFDPAAKRYDKSDGSFAFECFSMSPEDYKRKYKKDPASLTNPDWVQFDWYSAELVYVARYYERRLESVTLETWQNILTGHTAVYDADEVQDIHAQLKKMGYRKTGEEKTKRYRVYCSVVDGEEVLEEPVMLPGTFIPLIPFYGKRFYNEGKEQVEGFTQKAMDPQRALNLAFSMLAKETAEARPEKLVINTKYMYRYKHIWDSPIPKSYYPIHDADTTSGDSPVKKDPAPFTQVIPGSSLSPAITEMLSAADQMLTQLTGSAVSEQGAPANTSGKAINAITGRTDEQDFNYIDNLKKSIRHLGRVWISMSREVYGSERVVRIVKPNGTDELVVLSEQVLDNETGEVIGVNDLSQGKYDVVVGVGPAFATARQQAIENLLVILKELPLNPQLQTELAMYIIDMSAGEGLDDLKRVVHRQLLLQGAVEPKTPQEAQQVQQYQQQQAQAAQSSPENVIAQSQATKARADMFKSMSQLIDSGVNIFDTEADIQLKGSQMLKNLNDIGVSRATAAAGILTTFNKQQESLISTQLKFLGGLNGKSE